MFSSLEDNEVTRQLKRMEETYNASLSKKGLVPPNLPESMLRFQHKQQANYDKKHSQQREGHSVIRTINSSLYDVWCSNLPLMSLERIGWKDLRLETRYDKKYLLVQVVEDSYKINGLMTIVKDHQGSCFTLSIYNLVSDFNVVDATSFLPVGSILAIKEPYCKSTQGGGAMIRVDSPSDVIFIHQFDIFFEKLKVNEIRWSLRGQYSDAARAYTVGLNTRRPVSSTLSSLTISDDDEIDLLLTLNRCAAYLQDGRFEKALDDANTVLSTQPKNSKALERAGKACYGIRIFDKALEYFVQLNDIDDSARVKAEVARCQKRILEQSGVYDMNVIHYSPFENRLDIADYWNPCIEIAQIEGKGRGIVAKNDIQPGTLVMVSKAFQKSFHIDVKDMMLFELSFKTKRANRGTQMDCFAKVMGNVQKNKSQLQKIYSLYSGPFSEDRKPQRLFADVDEQEMIVDAQVIHHILSFNSFGSGVEKHDKEGDSTGIWIEPSFFNHSCFKNTTNTFFGDAMFLYTDRVILAGEELTISYLSPTDDYEKRQETVHKSYNFSCKCTLCTLDEKMSDKAVAKLKMLKEKYSDLKLEEKLKNGDLDRVISQVVPIVNSIRSVYDESGRTKFRMQLYGPLLMLASLYLRFEHSYAKSIKLFDELLADVFGFDVESFLGDKQDSNCFILESSLSPAIKMMSENYLLLGDKKKASIYGRALTKLHSNMGKKA